MLHNHLRRKNKTLKQKMKELFGIKNDYYSENDVNGKESIQMSLMRRIGYLFIGITVIICGWCWLLHDEQLDKITTNDGKTKARGMLGDEADGGTSGLLRKALEMLGKNGKDNFEVHWRAFTTSWPQRLQRTQLEFLSAQLKERYGDMMSVGDIETFLSEEDLNGMYNLLDFIHPPCSDTDLSALSDQGRRVREKLVEREKERQEAAKREREIEEQGWLKLFLNESDEEEHKCIKIDSKKQQVLLTDGGPKQLEKILHYMNWREKETYNWIMRYMQTRFKHWVFSRKDHLDVFTKPPSKRNEPF